MNETTQTFVCPSCGASLQPPSGAATMQCAYCGTSVVVPNELRVSQATNAATPAPATVDFGQLIGEAIRMSQVVRLARGGMRAEALQLYRENTGVEAGQAEQVITALISGHGQNPEMVRNEMATVGEAIAAMKMSEEMGSQNRRARRSGGLGCSGVFVLLILAAVALVAVYNSTGIAHDILIRLMTQLNMASLIH